MAEDNNTNVKVVHLKESYQPKVSGLEPLGKTYSPVTQGGNYQPVVATVAGSLEPRPPVGGSGVPPARNSGAGAAPAGAGTSAKNSSPD